MYEFLAEGSGRVPGITHQPYVTLSPLLVCSHSSIEVLILRHTPQHLATMPPTGSLVMDGGQSRTSVELAKHGSLHKALSRGITPSIVRRKILATRIFGAVAS